MSSGWYGRSYLDRGDAISLYPAELPVQPGCQDLPANLSIASVLRDAGPDAWGQGTVPAGARARR